MKIDRTVAVAAGGALVVLVAATALALRPWERDRYADCRITAIAGGPATIGGPFTLVDETGATVADTEVIVKPSLVYFGYTFCPDVCPTDLARNAEAVDLLAAQGLEVTPVFISVDPHRDTPERLKEWTDLIHPELIGLTGSKEQIDGAAKAYRVFYQVPDDISDPDYIVGHTTKTYLMSPKDGLLELFDSPDTPEKVAATTACFLKAG
jgi:protein SCO1/2